MKLYYKREPEGTSIYINGKLWGVAHMTGRHFEWEVLQKKTVNWSSSQQSEAWAVLTKCFPQSFAV